MIGGFTLYNKVGGVMKAVAIIIAVIGIIASFIIGINSRNQALSIIIGGSLASCLSVLVLYGFGELIEIAQGIHQRLSTIEMQNRHLGMSSAVSSASISSNENQIDNQEYTTKRRTDNKNKKEFPQQKDIKWVCQCGKTNQSSSGACERCGRKRKELLI